MGNELNIRYVVKWNQKLTLDPDRHYKVTLNEATNIVNFTFAAPLHVGDTIQVIKYVNGKSSEWQSFMIDREYASWSETSIKFEHV